MSSQKIARRYAAALMDQVKGDVAQQKQLDAQLAAIAQVFENKEIRTVIANPVVSADVHAAVFENISQQISAGHSLKQFIRVLIEGRRTALLPEVHEAFHRLYLESQSSVEAKVISAVALDSSELDQIKSQLEGMLSKKVLLETEIDKSILGGFVIKIDNSLIDMSLKTKLDNMTKFAVS